MPDPLTSTPTSPPAAPVIPVGLATTAGLAGAIGQWVAALIAAVLSGDHTGDTRTLLITGAVTLIATMAGRYAQAHAAIKGPSISSLVFGSSPDPTHAASQLAGAIANRGASGDEPTEQIDTNGGEFGGLVHQGPIEPDVGDAGPEGASA